jgi:hypothetical protein
LEPILIPLFVTIVTVILFTFAVTWRAATAIATPVVAALFVLAVVASAGDARHMRFGPDVAGYFGPVFGVYQLEYGTASQPISLDHTYHDGGAKPEKPACAATDEGVLLFRVDIIILREGADWHQAVSPRFIQTYEKPKTGNARYAAPENLAHMAREPRCREPVYACAFGLHRGALGFGDVLGCFIQSIDLGLIEAAITQAIGFDERTVNDQIGIPTYG